MRFVILFLQFYKKGVIMDYKKDFSLLQAAIKSGCKTVSELAYYIKHKKRLIAY